MAGFDWLTDFTLVADSDSAGSLKKQDNAQKIIHYTFMQYDVRGMLLQGTAVPTNEMFACIRGKTKKGMLEQRCFPPVVCFTDLCTPRLQSCVRYSAANTLPQEKVHCIGIVAPLQLDRMGKRVVKEIIGHLQNGQPLAGGRYPPCTTLAERCNGRSLLLAQVYTGFIFPVSKSRRRPGTFRLEGDVNFTKMRVDGGWDL